MEMVGYLKRQHRESPRRGERNESMGRTIPGCIHYDSTLVYLVFLDGLQNEKVVWRPGRIIPARDWHTHPWLFEIKKVTGWKMSIHKYYVDCVDGAGNTTTLTFSTEHCGTCTNFFHRSFRAGGCKIKMGEGEIGYDHQKCKRWELKETFETNNRWIMFEFQIGVGCPWCHMIQVVPTGYDFQFCICDNCRKSFTVTKKKMPNGAPDFYDITYS